jgi:hypothetical protein
MMGVATRRVPVLDVTANVGDPATVTANPFIHEVPTPLYSQLFDLRFRVAADVRD